MLTLPSPRTRGSLIGFWVVVCSLTGLFLLLVLGRFMGRPVGVGTLALFAGLSLPILVFPGLAAFPYRLWHFVARRFSRFAERMLLWISFYVVAMPVGVLGGRLVLDRPSAGESLWLRRSTQKAETYPLQDYVLPEGFMKRKPVLELTVWMFRSQHYWAVGLLPFIYLISMLQVEDRPAPTSNIYTLF
jgi:hypothetical protein